MTFDIITRLKAVREAGYVERCHNVGKTSGYNLAQHQYNVAMICLLLWPNDTDLVAAALTHDIPERWTGDIPAPVKRMNAAIKDGVDKMHDTIWEALDLPGERRLNADQMKKLHAADKLELYLWTFEEERRNGSQEYYGFRQKLGQWWQKEPPPQEVMNVLMSLYHSGWHRLPEVFEEI